MCLHPKYMPHLLTLGQSPIRSGAHWILSKTSNFKTNLSSLKCLTHHYKPTVMMKEAISSDLDHQPAAEEMDYDDVINLLNKLQKGHPLNRNRRSVSPKERTEKWLSLLGYDVDSLSSKFKIIHVAGTKGKGTTCYYCNHILHEYQKIYKKPERIGCYTSPHQVEVRDRIQINSESISKNLFAKHFLMLWNKIHALANRPELDLPVIPGYPGFLMLLAIYIFLLEETDVIIIETGIGGENDSTNVFQNPIATGITTIGLDHVEILGNSIEAIAWHKSGIFKPGCLAFTVEQDEAVLKVLRERAEEKGVAGPLEVVTERIVLDYRLTVTPDTHSQRLNAALAISLAGAYLKSIDPDFCMTTELAQSVEHLQLPGRCQTIADKNNTWLLSVAHNEISLRETIAWFKETIRHPEHICAPNVLIFSHQSKRDSISLLKVVYESLNTADVVTLHDVIFCTDQVDEAGKEKPDLIDLRTDRSTALKRQKAHAETWKALDGSSNVILKHTTREAVEFIRGNYKGARILVTGSHYLVGGTLDLLAKH